MLQSANTSRDVQAKPINGKVARHFVPGYHFPNRTLTVDLRPLPVPSVTPSMESPSMKPSTVETTPVKPVESSTVEKRMRSRMAPKGAETPCAMEAVTCTRCRREAVTYM